MDDNIWNMVLYVHNSPFLSHKHTRKHRWSLTWAICLQLRSHCFSTLCASSTSCLRREDSVYMLPVESRAGGVPGELWPVGKCSQILLLMPFKPTNTKQSYHFGLIGSATQSIQSTLLCIKITTGNGTCKQECWPRYVTALNSFW